MRRWGGWRGIRGTGGGRDGLPGRGRLRTANAKTLSAACCENAEAEQSQHGVLFSQSPHVV